MVNFQQQMSYHKRLIISLNLALLMLLLLLHIFPKRINHVFTTSILPPLHTDSLIEIPATRQYVRYGRPRPKRPVIPIASEDIELPEDLTIEDTEIDWELGDALFGNAGLTTSGGDTLQPRPYFQALPDYPKELRKQRVKGIVKLFLWVDKSGTVKQVTVAENTTNNKRCEQAAITAAQKNKYIPAQVDGETIPTWVTCIYSFTPE